MVQGNSNFWVNEWNRKVWKQLSNTFLWHCLLNRCHRHHNIELTSCSFAWGWKTLMWQTIKHSKRVLSCSSIMTAKRSKYHSQLYPHFFFHYLVFHNNVVQITTKQPHIDLPRWNLWLFWSTTFPVQQYRGTFGSTRHASVFLQLSFSQSNGNWIKKK